MNGRNRNDRGILYNGATGIKVIPMITSEDFTRLGRIMTKPLRQATVKNMYMIIENRDTIPKKKIGISSKKI